MRKFYVLWTYIANFSRLMPVEAKTPKEAIEATCGFFGEDFQKKATVFVFDTPPVAITYKGETKMTVEKYREASRGD